jgi:hypothetical protein
MCAWQRNKTDVLLLCLAHQSLSLRWNLKLGRYVEEIGSPGDKGTKSLIKREVEDKGKGRGCIVNALGSFYKYHLCNSKK